MVSMKAHQSIVTVLSGIQWKSNPFEDPFVLNQRS